MSALYKYKSTALPHLLQHVGLIYLCLIYGAYQKSMMNFCLHSSCFNLRSSTSSACFEEPHVLMETKGVIIGIE